MRQISEKEVQIVLQFETEMRSAGLIVDEEPEASQNGRLILAQFESQGITLEALRNVVEVLRLQLKWKSSAQIEYENLYNALTQTQKDAFGSWWYSQKHVLILDGDLGYINATRILGWMKGRSFDPRTFDLAVGNLAGTVGLHLVQQSTFRPGRHSGGDRSFMSKSDTNLSARDHARRTADAAASGSNPPPTTDYRAEAESVQGRTHSETERINRMFVMKLNPDGSSDIDWPKTNAARRRVAGL